MEKEGEERGWACGILPRGLVLFCPLVVIWHLPGAKDQRAKSDVGPAMEHVF